MPRVFGIDDEDYPSSDALNAAVTIGGNITVNGTASFIYVGGLTISNVANQSRWVLIGST